MKYIDKDKYKMVYPGKNVMILVDINKFLNRFKKDDSDFYIDMNTTIPFSIGRIEKAVDYIQKYSEDNRWINPKTNERMDYEVMFEPTLASINDGKMGIIDGRHRVVAQKKLGYTHTYIEVPKEQKELFNDII
jgi:hypothetical protein